MQLKYIFGELILVRASLKLESKGLTETGKGLTETCLTETGRGYTETFSKAELESGESVGSEGKRGRWGTPTMVLHLCIQHRE